MPTFAVLGATGATGQHLLNQLLQSPENTVNAYVRSKSRLWKLSPHHEDNNNLHVFEGALTDIEVIADCIANTSAVMCVLGATENVPGIHIGQDAAHSIVAACCHLRTKEPGCELPKILFLTSASINPHLCRDMPAIGRWAIHTALSYLYEDLEYAEAYFKLHKSWLDVTFIQPGGLVQDTQKGHELTVDRQQTFLSYPDLAAGIIETATTSKDKYSWQGLSVVPKTNDTKIEWRVPLYVVKGLIAHYSPATFYTLQFLKLF